MKNDYCLGNQPSSDFNCDSTCYANFTFVNIAFTQFEECVRGGEKINNFSTNKNSLKSVRTRFYLTFNINFLKCCTT